ncbi:unnamed protein product [Camellia sinensis]
MGKGGISGENMAAWLLAPNTSVVKPAEPAEENGAAQCAARRAARPAAQGTARVRGAEGARVDSAADAHVRARAGPSAGHLACGSAWEQLTASSGACRPRAAFQGDVHYLKNMRCGDYVVNEPMVIGHECAGVIEEVGSAVKSLMKGDRVALEPGISCCQCNRCKEGRYNLCHDMKFFATPPIHGSLANQIVHPASLCFKLPDNVSMEEGAMCEPLSVGVYACFRAQIGPTTNVLIIGAGPIDLVTMLATRAFGAPRIVIVDVDDHCLSVAKDLGADGVVKVSSNMQDVGKEVEQIRKAMGGEVSVTFDCTGFSKTMSTALSATASGGKVCLVGMGHCEMTVPLPPAAAREVDVVGIFRYKNTWPVCLEYLSSGRIDVKPLITHRFGFSQKEVEEAFETSARGGKAIKVMFNL